MACGDVLSLEDLQTAKKHQIFEAEVITGKVGGVAGGASIDTATNPVTGQTQQTLPSILADLGFDVQSWTSSTGGVLASANQVFLNDTPGSLGIGDYYAWGGPFEKTVPAGTDPALPTSGYIMRSSRFASTQAREALRRSYAEVGYNLVAGSFESGGTLTSAADVLLHEVSGKAYTGAGPYQQVVPAGASPASAGFVDQSGNIVVHLGNYAAIRAYSGAAAKIQCYGRDSVFDKAHGVFVRDTSDTTTVDNDGTVLVDASGRRWKRQYTGLVSVVWFGAKGDGVADDVIPIEKACAVGSPYFDLGIYRISRTAIIGTQRAFVGACPQSKWAVGGKCTIYGAMADIGDGNPLLQPVASGSSQAVTFENLSFRSDKVITPSDLASMTNSGVVGVNIRGIKQGTQFLNCCFEQLKSAVRDDIGTGNYQDKVTFNQCHFNGLYLATKINPTAGCSYVNCYFDECYNWIENTGEVTLIGTRFNNSSFSTEYCQIKATRILADGIYIEGGNNWFAPSQYVSVRGSYFSEAMSASGSTKFSTHPQNNAVHINIEGTRIGTNTRVVNTDLITDYKQLSVRFVGLTGGENFGSASTINGYIKLGMLFEGYSNTQALWNSKASGVGVLNGSLRTAGDGATLRMGNLARGVYWATSLSFTLSCPEDLEDYVINNQYARFVIIGTNNGTGGTAAFYTEVVIYKGLDATAWFANISGPDAATYAVTLSNKTATSVDVALTESHSGSGDVLFMDSASANMQIKF